MSALDQKLHREILATIYDALHPEFQQHVRVLSMVEDFDHLDEEELQYHITRLEDNRLVERSAQHHVQITAEGVEQLNQDGYDTLLESDLRYKILHVAYDIDRGTTHVYINIGDICDELDISEAVLAPHIWYLSEKGLLDRTGAGHFQLTADGRNRYEEYRNDGMPIPRTHPLQRFTQHTIEQGDREKAENVFREIVEVAREEVIVIDAYAKGRLYGMLDKYVPDVVDVKILMSDREFEDENIELYEDYADEKTGNVELRYLDYWDDYPFHTREVIRDREAGWIWDHTFADAGNRHHTISQLRPVNLETDLEAFDEAWAAAESVE